MQCSLAVVSPASSLSTSLAALQVAETQQHIHQGSSLRGSNTVAIRTKDVAGVKSGGAYMPLQRLYTNIGETSESGRCRQRRFDGGGQKFVRHCWRRQAGGAAGTIAGGAF